MLLVFNVQVVSAAVQHTLMTAGSYSVDLEVVAEQLPPCHAGQNQQVAEDLDTIVSDETCCDGECSMLGCHSYSATLVSIELPVIRSLSYSPSHVPVATLSATFDPHFRPPIAV